MIVNGVRDLIARHIRSFEQLEALLLLLREATKSWTAEQVAAELRTSQMSAAQTLEHLFRTKLIGGGEASGSFRYLAADPDLDRTVRELAVAYRERKVSVIDMIYARPSDPVRDFAAAFRLGKDKKDG